MASEALVRAFPAERLESIASEHATAYSTARPFPHVVLDNLFPESVLKALAREIPEATSSHGCSAANASFHSVCFMNKGREYRKTGISNIELFGPATVQVFQFLQSRFWVSFLMQLTGITGIQDDTFFSRVHLTARGGHLQVHAEFNQHKNAADVPLRRRVNTFLFLNPDWPQAYGGELELWERNMSACRQRIVPHFGRYVVFSSTDFSYHGHPQPLAAPLGRMRRSLALYYFTPDCPPEECLMHNCSGRGHSTLWQKPKGCKTCQDAECRAFPMEAS